MDLLDDIFVEPSTVKAPVRTKFQPKAKPQPKKGAKEQPTPSALVNSDTAQLIRPHQLNDNSDFPNSSPVTGNTEITSKDGHLAVGASLELPGPKETISQLTIADQESKHSKEIFDANGGDFQIDMEQETCGLSFLEAVDITSKTAVPPGNRAVNFQPKRRAETNSKTNSAQVASHIFDVGEVASESQYTNGDRLVHIGDVDDMNYGIRFDCSSPAEGLRSPCSNSDENNDDNHLEEETSTGKRLHNFNNISSESDKPSQKRMMEAKTPQDPSKKPRKRFPRGTGRKQYALLEAHEGETDMRTVAIRDLIMLADYRKRQAKKQEPAVRPSSTNKRSENAWQEDPPYGEDGTYGSDEDTGSLDDPSTSNVIKDTGYFNYKSFSDKRNRRWSRQETELFYQGIQEFGPDFTMIQQRHFVELSRHQVKLKYKKEERQCPMRIHDALTNRAKDLSHFEVLIKKLQEQEKGAREDDDECGEEETHETHATSQETAKSEENTSTSTLNQDRDNTIGVVSPAQSHDNEDEFDWNDYKSEL